MITKQFEREEYIKNDRWGKQKAKELLEGYDLAVEICEENFGYDLILHTYKQTYGVEVEVKRIRNTTWNYPTVDIPERRDKAYTLETMFILLVCLGWKPELEPIFNFAWLVHQRSLKKERLYQKKTWKEDLLKGEGQEWFFGVPIAECRILKE